MAEPRDAAAPGPLWQLPIRWPMRRSIAAAAVAIALTAATPAANLGPYQINVILSLSGNLAAVGMPQQIALEGVEAAVNASGGIGGRPLAFVFSDDQGDPKVALQLAQGLAAKDVPVILGPTSPQGCAAIEPLIEQKGPLLYCLANAGRVQNGSYEFFTLFPDEALMAATLRYFRERGLKRIAYIVSTDGGGQDAEAAILSQAARPENKDIVLVAKEHLAPADISAAAEMARIKAAAPDALIAWATGAGAGTMFRGARDVGLEVPTLGSSGDMSANFFKQYGAVLPADLYFAAPPYYAGDAVTDRATRAAIAAMVAAQAAQGTKPDMIQISAWDPGMVVVNAIRKLGTGVTAAQLRAYLAGLRGWTGVNGPYDYAANPQRGVGVNNVVIVRWDPARATGIPVSGFGGTRR